MEITEPEEPRSPQGQGLSMEQIEVQLRRLLRPNGASNEQVFTWISVNISLMSNILKLHDILLQFLKTLSASSYYHNIT